MRTLFDQVALGGLCLSNRMVMAPMIRGRADDDGVPGPAVATYYGQRASAGLIVTEGTCPSPTGRGYRFMAGLHSEPQVTAWREVTDRVHSAGGRIFAQLMHGGRISHQDLHGGALPVAPSAVRAARAVLDYEGRREFPTPRALATGEIAGTVEEFAAAARCAVRAGFDGVEIHGANGYLLHQFLAENTNRRTDAYGGTVPRRVRLVVEVAEAVAAAIGPRRVGLRLSPGSVFNDITEGDSAALYRELLGALAPLGLAYVHTMENGGRPLTRMLRELWHGPLVVSPRGGQLVHPRTGELAPPVGREAADEVIGEGVADLVAFGRNFLANPDLPHRLATGAPLNTLDPATYYPGGAPGYTDYPTLAEAVGPVEASGSV
ncbi:alkene reductase [Streptomyces sp. NPDC050560]|uniref:alkene reductase n=1 Tax=Streptomyces sp. NPDC050560 TaxID=3365630 RepID=UPI0037987DEC